MDPIPLIAVRAAVADVVADTSDTAVAALIADIAGAAADIAADARAATLADAAADTAVVAADARAAALADDAADVAAAVDSTGDLTVALAAYAAIVASTSPAPPAASGFGASGQGMAAVGPVRAPVELLHANETTRQLC